MSGNSLLAQALAAADETRVLVVAAGALRDVPEIFRAQFGDQPARVVADATTFEVAGRRVIDAFARAGRPCAPSILFPDQRPYAEYGGVERIEEALRGGDAVPVAVGSGTINDLVKRAAHQTGRPYLVVATAASMDGYTAFGASITFRGSKQTFSCAAPRAVIADLEIIAAAPPEMNASGYADLMAKVTAGADWIVADALGEEAIELAGWTPVQDPLRGWLAHPDGIRRGDLEAIRGLVEGLMMGGFAMQATKSSRCASGAEHQFSHLWDMEHHVYKGVAPSHGFKVGIATLAITRFYEALLERPLDRLDPEKILSCWPSREENERRVRGLYKIPEIAEKAAEESAAKYADRERLRGQIERLREAWSGLRARLKKHLIPSNTLGGMLMAAGAPTDAREIGIPLERLRQTFILAQPIRRRFTVLDLALHCDLLEQLSAEAVPCLS